MIHESGESTYLISQIRESVWGGGHDYTVGLDELRISDAPRCCYYNALKKIFPAQASQFEVDDLGKFAVGNLFHDGIQTKLPPRVVIAKEFEVMIDAGICRLVGHPDLLSMHPVYGLVVTDIKSANSVYFVKNDPKLKDWMQANNYAMALKVPVCSVLYVEKNRFRMMEHIRSFSKSLWDDQAKKIENVFSVPYELLKDDDGAEQLRAAAIEGSITVTPDPEVWSRDRDTGETTSSECKWKDGQCSYFSLPCPHRIERYVK